jgi:hypothetical protein
LGEISLGVFGHKYRQGMYVAREVSGNSISCEKMCMVRKRMLMVKEKENDEKESQ